MTRKQAARIRYLRTRRSYLTRELAELLDVSPRTVEAWREAGLRPLDETTRPNLYLGRNVKEFLRVRLTARKCPLAADEFYCTRCRTGRRSLAGEIVETATGKLFENGKEQILLLGECSECGQILVRFGSRKAKIAPDLDTPAKEAKIVLTETVSARAKSDTEGV
jgi:DNA-binding XRE family transcriptional regulator